MSKKLKEPKKPVTVKLSEATIKKVGQVANKEKRTIHYLLCEAINQKYKA